MLFRTQLSTCRAVACDWSGVWRRGCDEAEISEKKRFLAERFNGGRYSMNQGFGREFYRKGNSVKK